MKPRRQLIDSAPACDRDALQRGFDAAMAFGIDRTGLAADSERLLGAHDLMCRAGEAAIDLALVAQIFKAQLRLDEELSRGDFRMTSRSLHASAAGSTRLVARALEVHARDTGYAKDVWIATAFDTTNLFLQDSRDAGRNRVWAMPPLYARIAARSLFDALAASNADRMAVPGYLADSLGANLALFMHVHAVVAGAAPTGNGDDDDEIH